MTAPDWDRASRMLSLRIFQITILLFLALGIFLIVEGWKLGIQGMYGPGPGMFAALVGMGMAVLAGVWLVRLSFPSGREEVPQVSGDRAGLIRVALVVAGLVAFALLLRPIGFNLSMFLLLLALLIGFGRERIFLKIVVASLASFGTHYVFETMLRVPLPYASLPMLRSLGL